MQLKKEIIEFSDSLVVRFLPKNQRLRSLTILLLGAALAAVAIVGPWSGAGLIAAGMEYATFPMQRERIETVRAMLKKAPCGAESMAYHTALVAWNERIAHEHEANRHWYSDPFSPDWWLDVALLDVPECGR